MLYNKSIDKFFSEESMLDFSTMIYRIPALLFAITIHEYAHAQCADRRIWTRWVRFCWW